jgi:ketosteroid isomerase-like protein
MSATSEQNKVLVRRLWEAMNNRQLEALDALLAPDVVRHCEATPGVDVRSLEQFKDFMRQDAAVFPDSVQTITHLVAEGDLVAVWQRTKAHSRDRWGRSHRRGGTTFP